MLGHNEPPEGDALVVRLKEENADLTERRDALLESCGRMPDAVADDDDEARFIDQAKVVKKAAKIAKDRHKSTKEPFLEGGRTVDGFFKRGFIDPLETAAKQIERAVTAYQVRKAEAERRQREEAARKAAEEAARLAEEAANDNDLEDAIAAESVAHDTAKEAQASTADLSRARGDYGGVGSLQTRWAFEITDVSQLDLGLLRPHFDVASLEKAIRSYMRAGGRDLPGARIYEEQRTVIR